MVFGADPIARMIRTQNIARDAKILDVGCGDGRFLELMHGAGYQNLAGVDPFLVKDTSTASGVPLYKKSFDEIHDAYDLIMFHHSLEHMPDPVNVFDHLSVTLRRGGVALIRVPLCDSEAYRLYGVNWIQADPPRHLYLFTRKSMQLLAARYGFVVERVVYDSTALQLWGSEQARRGIPLCDKNSYFVNKNSAKFTRSEIKSYALRANDWNMRGIGDQAAFFLRHAGE
jgi:SAM-dependent methyltransferase